MYVGSGAYVNNRVIKTEHNTHNFSFLCTKYSSQK